MPVQSPLVIYTERLILRPFKKDDWEAVHDYAVDPQISRFQPWGPNSIKDTKLFIEKCINSTVNSNGAVFFFSISLSGTDRHIGGCVITVDPASTGDASIGYTIGRKYWNQGYATEAATALLKLAFMDLGLRRVTSNCDSANVASWRVMEKAGMQYVYTEVGARYFKGQWRDWLEYAITDDEWRENNHQD